MSIHDINELKEHEVAELFCVNCKSRWIGVFPSSSLLKDAKCECGAVGMIIKTGQTLPEEDWWETKI